MATKGDRNMSEVYSDYNVINSYIFICTCWFCSHCDPKYLLGLCAHTELSAFWQLMFKRKFLNNSLNVIILCVRTFRKREGEVKPMAGFRRCL